MILPCLHLIFKNFYDHIDDVEEKRNLISEKERIRLILEEYELKKLRVEKEMELEVVMAE